MIFKTKKTVLCSILAAILLIMPISSVLAQTVFSEKGLSQQIKYDSNGALKECSTTIRESNGGPISNTIKDVGFSPLTVLELEVSLKVAKGSYKIEFQKNDETTLVLEASDGTNTDGVASVSVDSMGHLSYIVTAEQAENVELHILVR
jgi:hypothetical protein